MKQVTVAPRSFIPPGRIQVTPDIEQPGVEPWTTIDDAGHLLVTCNPRDEQRVREAIALEQARPLWWREIQRIEAELRARPG